MIFLLLNISLAVIPALILLVYFYKKDKQKKEPVSLILKVFSFGFLSVLPAIAIEMLILQFVPDRFSIFNIMMRAFIVAGLVEEGIKLKTVLLVAYPSKNFDEVTDGIVYTISASLGFALFENIFYSFGPASTLGGPAAPGSPVSSVVGDRVGPGVSMNDSGLGVIFAIVEDEVGSKNPMRVCVFSTFVTSGNIDCD